MDENKTNENRLLGAILFIAFVLRVTGFGFGLPHVYHQDEPIVVNHALAYANFDFNPHFFKIPPLVSYMLFAAYGVYYLILSLFQGVSAARFAELFFADPTGFYLIGRLLFGVLAGTASVWILYRLARELVGVKAAFWSALFFAVNYLHVRDSHYLYVDIPMIFSMLCLFDCAVGYAKGRWSYGWIACSVWAGIALAFKYIAAPILIPALWVAGRPVPDHPMSKGSIKRAMAALGVAGLVFILLNPYAIADRSFFINELRTQAQAEGSTGIWHHALYSLLEGCGMWVLMAGIIGLIVVWRRQRIFSFFWSFPFIYYAMISVFSQPYERYAMPIVPFLCVGAAYAVDRLSGVFKTRFVRLAVCIFMAVMVSAVPILKSVQLDRLAVRTDTRTLAREWIEQTISAGSAIVLDHSAFSPRLWQTGSQIRQKASRIAVDDLQASAKTKKLDLLAQIAGKKKTYEVYYLNERGAGQSAFASASPGIDADFKVLQKSRIRYFVRYRYPKESRFFEENLASHAKLLAIFSPYKDVRKIYTEDEWANVAMPFRSRELFSRERPGPYLEIYELNQMK